LAIADYDQAETCFNHVLRIRKSLRQDESNHPDVLNASKMESRISYMKRKMERAKRKEAKRDARRRRKIENDARMLLVQAEEDASKMRQTSDALASAQQPKSEDVYMPMKPPTVEGTRADVATGAKKVGRKSKSNDAIRRHRSRSRSREKRSMARAGTETTEGEEDADADAGQSYNSSDSGHYGTTSGEDEGSENFFEGDISDLSASMHGKPSRRGSNTFSETQSAGTGTKEGDSKDSTEDLYKRDEAIEKEANRRSRVSLEASTASSLQMQKRKEKRRGSEGALNNALIDEAVEKLSIKDLGEESATIPQKLRSAYQKFDTAENATVSEAAVGASAVQAGPRRESLFRSSQKLMDAVKNLKGSLGDEIQQPQSRQAKDDHERTLQPVDEKDADDMNAESYESDGTPEDFDEDEFSKSLVASNDEEEDDESDHDGRDEGAYDDAFDEFTAASAPFSVVDGRRRSGDTVVSAMNESTASDWREEQSLVANMLRNNRRPSKSRRRRRNIPRENDGDGAGRKEPPGDTELSDDDQGGSAGGLSLEEWQKFKKAAQNIHSNANANANAGAEVMKSDPKQASHQPAPSVSRDIGREDAGSGTTCTKPKDLELEREYSVVCVSNPFGPHSTLFVLGCFLGLVVRFGLIDLHVPLTATPTSLSFSFLLAILCSSSMIDTTASDWHSRQRVAQDAPDDVQALEDVSAGNYALTTGSYEEARTRFTSALRKMVHILGPDHEEVSLVQEMLGDACARLGELKEAHGHYQLARQNLHEKLGRHDRNVTRIMVSLGNLYFESGNFSRALNYHTSILELRRENLDENHPDVLESVEKCMEVHEAMVARAIGKNDHDMAFFHAREIIWLGLSSECAPPSNIGEAQVLDLVEDVKYSYLESSLDKNNEERKARTYYREAKKLLKQTGGSATGTELCAMMDNIAGILLREKKTESALRCYEEKFEFLDRHKVDDPKLICDTLRKLGSLCNKCDRHEEAIVYQEKAFGIYRQSNLKSSKDGKLDYERTMRSLGATHLASGNYSASMKYFKSYLGACAMPEKPYVLLTMGVLYSKMYQITEALNCYSKALQLEAKSSGEEDKATLASISHLQDIFLSTKKRPKDSTCYEKALDSQDMKQILVNLGYVQLKNRTHKEDGEAQLDRHAKKSARHFAKEILGYLDTDGETLDITCVLRSMGNVLSRRRRYKEAIEYYEKFLTSKKSTGSNGDGHSHQEIFESLTDLGTAYIKIKEKEKAFASFQKALDELELCSDAVVDGVRVEGNLKALVAPKDEGSAASRATDAEYLMGLLICRLGMVEKGSELLGNVQNKKLKSSVGSGTPDTAKVFIDGSTLTALRGDMEGGRAAFDDGMQRLQQEKLPYFHPYMGQLRRLYDFFNSKAMAKRGYESQQISCG